jgi:hypothetical protein
MSSPLSKNDLPESVGKTNDIGEAYGKFKIRVN